MFRDKVILITGGGGGIGSAVARRFGRAGAKIALVDLHDDAVQARLAELEGDGIEAMGLACDITDPEACARAASDVVARFGGIDVLVNCAGLTQVGPFADNDLSVYRRVMDVNFFGSVYCTKAALPALRERKGIVITLSSIAGFAPLLGRTGYCASKHAVHGFFNTLRCELSDDGVGVMIVCPSFVQTAFADSGLGSDGKPLSFNRSTTGKMMTPDDVADRIYEGACRRTPLLVLSSTGKLAYWVSRLFPNYYERNMTRRFKIEMDR